MRPSLPLHLLADAPDYVAVDKPAGLAVIPGRGEETSLLEILGAQIGLPVNGTADPRLRMVHRIDKDTTGVLLLAKHVAAQRTFSHQFQNNTTRKEYLALVAGRMKDDAGEIDAPIGQHPTNKLVMITTKHGRPARTEWKVEERFRDYTLVRVFPRTGKTHQIRVHLRSIGHPLAVDPLYNPKRDASGDAIYLSQFKRKYHPSAGPERPLIDRLTLHAQRLEVIAPDGTPLQLVSELPKDFRSLLNQLRKANR